jgi:hypothetical protein
MGMTRPEGPVFALVLGAFKIAKLVRARQMEYVAKIIVWSAGFVFIYGGYFLWRFLYYGQLFPNTYYAKTFGGYAQYERGLEYVRDFFVSFGFLFEFFSLVALFGLIFLLKNKKIQVLIACSVTYCMFIIYSGGDWMNGYRFFVQVYPLFAILFTAGIIEIWQRLKIYPRHNSLIYGCAFSLLIISSLYYSNNHIQKEIYWLKPWWNRLSLVNPHGSYYKVAKFFNENSKPGETVALGEAGIIPYYARDIHVIDILGLMDTHIAHLPGLLHYKGDAEYVLKKDPSYIVLLVSKDSDGKIRHAIPPMQQFLDNKFFNENYQLIRTQKRGKVGENDSFFHIYKKKKVVASSYYDFYDNFEQAEIGGYEDRDDTPWGKNVAKVVLEHDGKKWAIFSLPGTSLSYPVAIPRKGKASLETSLCIHPVARSWGSDGFRMKVEVTAGRSFKTIADDYVLPENCIDVNAPLDEFAGKEVIVKFSVTNDPGKNGLGDWAAWVEPRIVSAVSKKEADKKIHQAIGHEYLKKFPEENDPTILNSLIFDWPDEAFNSQKEVHKFILEKVKKDFQEDRIVEIRGWILSRTETRLCALAALLGG